MVSAVKDERLDPVFGDLQGSERIWFTLTMIVGVCVCIYVQISGVIELRWDPSSTFFQDDFLVQLTPPSSYLNSDDSNFISSTGVDYFVNINWPDHLVYSESVCSFNSISEFSCVESDERTLSDARPIDSICKDVLLKEDGMTATGKCCACAWPLRYVKEKFINVNAKGGNGTINDFLSYRSSLYETDDLEKAFGEAGFMEELFEASIREDDRKVR